MARRGRKRRPGRREANGRHQRVSSEAEREAIISVVLDARRRVYGVTDAEARRMKATDHLARMEARGEIEPREYEAALRYAALMQDYELFFIPGQRPQKAGDLDRVSGYDDSDGDDASYVERWNRVKRDVAECRAALKAAQSEKHEWLVTTVIESCVLQGRWQEGSPYIKALKTGLNALADVFQKKAPISVDRHIEPVSEIERR